MDGAALVFHLEFVVQYFKFDGKLLDSGVVEMFKLRQLLVIRDKLVCVYMLSGVAVFDNNIEIVFHNNPRLYIEIQMHFIINI